MSVPAPESSRSLSLSASGKAKAKAKGVAGTSGRRESPLAAAARRAKEALATSPPRHKTTEAKSPKSRVSPNRRPPGSQTRKEDGKMKEKSLDGKFEQVLNRPVGKIEKNGFTVPSRETSAGSTPKCVLSEARGSDVSLVFLKLEVLDVDQDTSSKMADNAEILEARGNI